MNNPIHIPVMLNEILDHLNIQENDCIIEGTMGFLGHGQHIIKTLNNTGTYIGLDQDNTAYTHCKSLLQNTPNAFTYHTNFSDFDTIIKKHPTISTFSLFLDLGVSSHQLDSKERGFSHRFESNLDMRMNTNDTLNAQTILNTYSKEALSNIFYTYGELKHNTKLVSNILQARKIDPIITTTDLKNIIKKSYYFYNKRSAYMKTCSQVFQALRIEVNQELSILQQTLNKIETHHSKIKKAVIITFHSLEDRMVKHFIKQSNTLQFNPKSVTKPSKIERTKNPRSRSAKCRVIIPK